MFFSKKLTESSVNKLLEELELAGYFKFVKRKEEIEIWKNYQKKGLLKDGWFYFPDQAHITKLQTGKYPTGIDDSFTFREIGVDGESLFSGGLMSYLKDAKGIFEIRGLRFDFRDEKMEWGESDESKDYQYFKHEVFLNDEKIVVADGNLNELGGSSYLKKYFEILSEELEKQNYPEKFRLISQPDGVSMILIDQEIEKVFKKLPKKIKSQFISDVLK